MPAPRRTTLVALAATVVAVAMSVGAPAAIGDDAEPSPTTPTLPPAGVSAPEPLVTTPTPPTAPVTSEAAAAATAPPSTVALTTPPTPEVPVSTVRRRAPRRGPADLVTVDPGAKGPARIEVDISAQRLYLYRGRTLYRTLHVSTGSGRRYCVKGDCAVARTPRGRFRVYSRIGGWRTSRLGKLYNPLYFNGGYAIHGAGSVPAYPASHGCVRISMSNAGWLPSAVPNGTPVWVHD